LTRYGTGRVERTVFILAAFCSRRQKGLARTKEFWPSQAFPITLFGRADEVIER
jgi:hypothetical protein